MGQHDHSRKPASQRGRAERPAGPAQAQGCQGGMQRLLRTPGLASPELIRSLGRSVGNRAVARMLAPPSATPVIQRVVSINNQLLPDQTKTKSYGRLTPQQNQRLQDLITDRIQIYDFPNRAALYAYVRNLPNAALPTVTPIPQAQLEEARKKRRQAVFNRKTESESHLSSNDAFHNIPREQLYRLTKDRWWLRNPLTNQYERRKKKGTAAIPNEELLEYVDPKNSKKENYGYLRGSQVITTRTDPSSTAHFSRKGATGIQYTDARGGFKSRRVFPGVNSGKPINPFKRATDHKTFTIGHSQAVKNMHRGLDKYGKNSDEQSRMMVPENRKVGEQMKNPALEPDDQPYVWNNFYNANPDTTLSGNPIPDNTEATIFQPSGKAVDFNVFLDNTGNTDYSAERAKARGTRKEKEYTYGVYMKEKLSRPYEAPPFFSAEDDGAVSDDEEVPRTPAYLPQFYEEQTHESTSELPYGSSVDIGNKKWDVGWFAGKSATGGKNYHVSRPRLAPIEESDDESEDEAAQQQDALVDDALADNGQPPALNQQPSVDDPLQPLLPKQPSLSDSAMPLLQQQQSADYSLLDDPLLDGQGLLSDEEEAQDESQSGVQLPSFADFLRLTSGFGGLSSPNLGASMPSPLQPPLSFADSLLSPDLLQNMPGEDESLFDQLPFFDFGQNRLDDQQPPPPTVDQQPSYGQHTQDEQLSFWDLLPPLDNDQDIEIDQQPQQSDKPLSSDVGLSGQHGSKQSSAQADSSKSLLDLLLQDQQDVDFTTDLLDNGLVELPGDRLLNDDEDLFQSSQQLSLPETLIFGGASSQSGSSWPAKQGDQDSLSAPPAKKQKMMSQQEIALDQQRDRLSLWVQVMLDLLAEADQWIGVRAHNNEDVSNAQQQIGWAEMIVVSQIGNLNAMPFLQQPLGQNELALCDDAWSAVIDVLRLLAVRGPIHQPQQVDDGIYLLPSLEQHFHECGQMSMHTALALDAHGGSLAGGVPNALVAALHDELNLRQLGGFEDDIDEDQIRAGLAQQGVTHIPIVNGLAAVQQLVELFRQAIEEESFEALEDAYGEQRVLRELDALNRLYLFFIGQIDTLTVIVNTDAEQEQASGYHWITARLERTQQGGINVFYTDSLRELHNYNDLLNGLRAALTSDEG